MTPAEAHVVCLERAQEAARAARTSTGLQAHMAQARCGAWQEAARLLAQVNAGGKAEASGG